MSKARLPRRSGLPSSKSMRRAGIRRNGPKVKVSSFTGKSPSRIFPFKQAAKNFANATATAYPGFGPSNPGAPQIIAKPLLHKFTTINATSAHGGAKLLAINQTGGLMMSKNDGWLLMSKHPDAD